MWITSNPYTTIHIFTPLCFLLIKCIPGLFGFLLQFNAHIDRKLLHILQRIALEMEDVAFIHVKLDGLPELLSDTSYHDILVGTQRASTTAS
jgi:hypothetical protein